MGKFSKDKGSRGERELAKVFREYGFNNARRTQQFCGRGGESADVIGLPNIHVESKRTERLNLYDAIAQAKNDAKEGNLPAVFHRRNNCEWLVIMPIDSWMEIYREYYSGVHI